MTCRLDDCNDWDSHDFLAEVNFFKSQVTHINDCLCHWGDRVIYQQKVEFLFEILRSIWLFNICLECYEIYLYEKSGDHLLFIIRVQYFNPDWKEQPSVYKIPNRNSVPPISLEWIFTGIIFEKFDVRRFKSAALNSFKFQWIYPSG